MAFTQTQYDQISEAIAQGALTVKYNDKEVTYRSLDEMIRIRTMMAAELGLNTGVGKSRAIRTTYRSGLHNTGQSDNRFADGCEWERN